MWQQRHWTISGIDEYSRKWGCGKRFVDCRMASHERGVLFLPPLECFFQNLAKRTTQKPSRLWLLTLCAGNPLLTSVVPEQRVNNVILRNIFLAHVTLVAIVGAKYWCPNIFSSLCNLSYQVSISFIRNTWPKKGLYKVKWLPPIPHPTSFTPTHPTRVVVWVTWTTSQTCEYRNWYQYWGHCCLINDLWSSPQPEGEARGLSWASQVVNETTMTEIEVSISILSRWNKINDE